MLTIDSVTLNFGDRDILSGCYLNGKKGEIVGLLGRNGSGKSCLLKIIFGTQKAGYKHLRIKGKIVEKPYLSKQVCYLPQQHFLPPFLKVNTIINQGMDEVQDKELLEFLLKHGTKRIKELSGGELRIVECLWILNQPADYILLDEPFSGIAPLLVEFLQKIIRNASKNKCIILTDHIYRALFPISDRILLLHNNSLYSIQNEYDLSFYGYIPNF